MKKLPWYERVCNWLSESRSSYSYTPPPPPKRPPEAECEGKNWVVSIVLTDRDDSGRIRLALNSSHVRALSEEEALGFGVTTALRKNPGYQVALHSTMEV